MVPTALQMKTRQIDKRLLLGILFVLIVVGVFWASVSSAGGDECGFEGTSIRVYVEWEGFWGFGPYRAFIWNAEGLKKIEEPSPPEHQNSGTNVDGPWGDKPAFGSPARLTSSRYAS